LGCGHDSSGSLCLACTRPWVISPAAAAQPPPQKKSPEIYYLSSRGKRSKIKMLVILVSFWKIWSIPWLSVSCSWWLPTILDSPWLKDTFQFLPVSSRSDVPICVCAQFPPYKDTSHGIRAHFNSE
jgi:hypothetical protein